MSIWHKKKKEEKMNNQDSHDYCEQFVLDKLQAKEELVQIFLLGGTRIIGRITGSDDHTIMISRDRIGEQMIYKSAVTTISHHTKD